VQQSGLNKDDEMERSERKAFRVAIGSSLGALAIAMKARGSSETQRGQGREVPSFSHGGQRSR
jgi:hypothetical protein